jgi:general secretion pathway protein L
MPDSLLVRLAPPDPASPCWVTVDDTGQVLETGSANLADAVACAAGRRVIGLVPATEVLRTSVQLPVRSRAKLAQLLPFAMEEQLAEDVEQLHFAAGRADSDAPLPVAVARRDRVVDWLAQLHDAGLDPAALYSEADGMDELPGTGVLFLEPGRAVLRRSDGAVIAMDLDGLEAAVQLWLASAGEAATGAHLLAYVDPACAAELEPRLDAIRSMVHTLDVKVLGDGLLARLAGMVVGRPGVNLLQGQFAKRSNLGRFWPQWRLAAALLAGLAVIATGAKIAETWRLGREAVGLRAAVEQAFRYTFPDVRTVRDDVRGQFDSQLRALGAAGPTDNGLFLNALQTVARAIGQGGGARLEGVDYRSGVMELRLRAPSVEALDRIQRDIAGDGHFEAEIQSANADDGAVLGRLRVRVAGA